MKPIHIGIGLTAVVLALALLELGPVMEVLAPYRAPSGGNTARRSCPTAAWPSPPASPHFTGWRGRWAWPIWGGGARSSSARFDAVKGYGPAGRAWAR